MNSQDSRLQLAPKLHQESVWPSVGAVTHGTGTSSPFVIELDPTTFCDMSCPECISGRLLNRGSFTTQRLLRLAYEIIGIGVRAVILIGGGEPLAHPATKQLIPLLSHGGVKIGLTTNGTLIERHLDVIARHASWTRVSVDAATAITYGIFRPHRSGQNKFASVIAGMRALALRKAGALGYSFLLMSRDDSESNIGEVAAAARLAKEIGCDYFEIKPMFTSDHFIAAQSESVRKSIEIQLIEARNLECSSFSVVSPPSLEVLLTGKPLEEPKPYDRCLISELRTVVTPDGVFVCPYHRGDGAKSYGNVTDATLEEIWNSSQRREVLKKVRPSHDCRFHCIRHDCNTELLRIAAGGDAGPPVADYDLFI